MKEQRRGLMSRSFGGPAHAEGFVIVAIATILITRLYLKLTGYPQIGGGGNLHIAHSLFGGALMMLALVIGWLLLGAGVRTLTVVVGGVGFGLILDEVGKFVTKTNNYFYGPAAEIMYITLVVILVGTRLLRTIRPLSAGECLASASAIAADGVARGLGDHRREVGLRLVERARAGADPTEAEHVRALLLCARTTSDRLYAVQRWLPRLIPAFLKDPRWATVVGWLVVLAALFSLSFHALGVVLGGRFYGDVNVAAHLGGMNAATAILLATAVLTLAMALPATLALRRTEALWPLRLLREAALLFTLLSALVHFATEGFAALIDLSIGLLAMGVLSYQLDLREQAEVPVHAAEASARD